MNRALALLTLTILATGCVPEGGDVDVLATGDVEFRWDPLFNEVDDGAAALIPLDVMVFDDLTGEPLAGVLVSWRADAAAFADADAVMVGEPECEACVYDAWRDAWVELVDGTDGEASWELDAAVVPLHTRTDADGLSRVYAVVDAVDADRDGAFLPVHVDVQAMGQERVFDLLPR